MDPRPSNASLITIQQVVRLLAHFGVTCDEATAAVLLQYFRTTGTSNPTTSPGSSSSNRRTGASRNSPGGPPVGPPIESRTHTLGSADQGGSGVAVCTSASVPLIATAVKSEDQTLCDAMATQCSMSSPVSRIPKGRKTIVRAPEKWFAIVKGSHVGVVYSWARAGQYVLGYSGAIYQGYKTEQEASDRFWLEFPDNIHSGTGVVFGVPGITHVPAST